MSEFNLELYIYPFVAKLVDEKRRNEDGFNTVPCLLECEKCYELEADPVSKALVKVTLTAAEKELDVEDLMRECDQYYDDNKETIRSLIEEPERKKARVTTGTPREFETGDHVMVKYPDKWHHGIVTNYFSTSQAKGKHGSHLIAAAATFGRFW